jgi:hypothetical protein
MSSAVVEGTKAGLASGMTAGSTCGAISGISKILNFHQQTTGEIFSGYVGQSVLPSGLQTPRILFIDVDQMAAGPLTNRAKTAINTASSGTR